jgi:hypothetical protein
MSDQATKTTGATVGGRMSESSAFQALLWEVSNKVSAATALLQNTINRMETLAREHAEMRDKISRLEEDKEWKGQERREAKESGDHTFELFRQQAANAEASAAAALREVKAMRDLLSERGGTRSRTPLKSWLVKAVVEGVVPLAVSAIVSAIGWLIYHGIFLAKLAESARTKGGSP